MDSYFTFFTTEGVWRWLKPLALVTAIGLVICFDILTPVYPYPALGITLSTLIIGVRYSIRRLSAFLERKFEPVPPEPWGAVAVEWLALAVVLSISPHLVIIWPAWAVVVGLLVAAALPTFEFVFRPLWPMFSGRLRPASKDLHTWTASMVGENIPIYVYEGLLWNAIATGVLPFTRHIVLGQPLVENLTKDELRSIVAHELGHIRFRHATRMYLIMLAASAVIAIVFRLLFTSKWLVLVSKTAGALVSAIVGGVLGGLLFGVLPGLVLRRLELEADRFAAEVVGKDWFAQALERLDQLSKGRVRRGGLTHPPLVERLAAIGYRVER